MLSSSLSVLTCAAATMVLICLSSGVKANQSILKSKPLPMKEVCVGGRLDSKELMVWLFDTYPVTLKAHDYDNNKDYSHTDRVISVFDKYYCKRSFDSGQDKCSVSKNNDTRANFGNSRDYLRELFGQLREGQVDGYRYSGPVPSEETSLLVDVDAEFIRAGELAPGAKFEITVSDAAAVDAFKFVIGHGEAGEIECFKPQKEEQKPRFSFTAPAKENIRVRGSTDDIRKMLTKDKKKEISAATASIVKDKEGDTTEYNISSVVAYKFASLYKNKDKDSPASQKRDHDVDFLVYVGVERKYASGDDDAEEIDNINLGLDVAFQYTPDDVLNFKGDLRPQFTIDSEADTKIGSLNLDLTPTWTFEKGTFPNAAIWGNTLEYVAFLPIVIARAKGGYVFDDGGNDDLSQSKTFFRVGGKLGAKLLFTTNTLFDGIVPFVNYEYLNGVKGKPANSDRVEAGIEYVFPEIDYLTLGLKYTSGEADETFEDVDSLEVRLGAKF